MTNMANEAHDIVKSSLIPLVKTNNNLMEILPDLFNVEKKNFKITPSEFIKEMNLTSEERHKLTVHTGLGKKLLNSSYPFHFKVTPHILVFQKFEARSTNFLILQIKNTGNVILPLKMFCPSSLYFTANFSGTPMYKLAPGLSAEYKVIFTPEEYKDYCHQLIFRSKEDTFNVPIVGIGPRALLSIPDQIILNPAPVKSMVTKCIVVQNLGDIPALFTLITQSPFKVHPAKGFLKTHESMIVTISFNSSEIGEIIRQLLLTLESGETLTITLQGAAENICVRLDKNSVVHEDTFIGLKRSKSVHIINNSSNLVKFAWKKNKTLEDDMNIIKRMKNKYENLMHENIFKYTEVDYFGLSDFEGHTQSCERILENELQLLEKEDFNFSHEAVSIVPQMGKVWPKSFAEITVSFEPKNNSVVNVEAYLEVSGRDERLPLQIKANGLGPRITLSPQTLNIDYVYLCSVHKYEVIAINKGDIPGKIQYKPEPSVFGGKLEVEPNLRCLNPGDCGVFIVTFTSNKQGEFTEQIAFNIVESGEMIYLTLTGKIVNPTLHFDVRGIDFGTIPFGFPTVHEVKLNNLSVVPVTFSLKVLSNGDEPSLSYERFAARIVKPSIPLCPKEFHIDPEESVVEPFSSKKVTLTLTSNKPGRFHTHLVMDMWDSESGSVSCPIRFKSVVPTLTAEPETITIPFCFINFPYTRSITLKNLSKVAGFFYIVPLNPNEQTSITCSANKPQGVIQPGSSIKIDLTVITTSLGRHVLPINLLVFGNEELREVCMVSCVGQGPVVTAYPYNLLWGELNLLEKSQKTLIINNESPIPAILNIFLVKPNSQWSTSSSNLTLAASETLPFPITLFLNDRGKFNDTLRINVHNGKVLNIHLSAVGVGSSLKISPKISPTYDLGTLFSRKKYEFEIMIENKGTKCYGLVWSPFQEYSHFVTMKLANPADLTFKIEPTKIDVMPGEVKTITLMVQSISTGFFKQMFYCFASIGVPTKELHLTSEVFADFAEPLIGFDKQELRYWCNLGFDTTEQKLEDEVMVSNKSVLPLRVSFSVRHPFRLEIEPNQNIRNFEMNMGGNECKRLKVKFLPEIKPEKISRVFHGDLIVTFKEHSKKFLLPLIGEVNYPNLLILPKNINFEFVPLSCNVYKKIHLINISPMTIHYEIIWNSATSKLVRISKGHTFKEQILLPQNLDITEEILEECEDSIKCSESMDITGSNGDFKQNELNEECLASEKRVSMPTIVISKTDIKRMLFPLVQTHYHCEDELMRAYQIASSSKSENFESVPDYAKVCDIIPFYGKLEKFSSQVLSVRFYSETAINIHLEALVNIKSGPTELITIDAASSEVDFRLSSTELDFGKQLFCKPAKQVLKIQNTSDMPFVFEVNLKENCHLLNKFSQNQGLLTVSPMTGTVGSFAEFDLTVTYLAKIPGKFEDKFILQVAYVDPIIIKIKGFGVFPHIYISLPRTGILDISPDIGYYATASITPDWLLTGSYSSEEYDIKPYRSRESNIDNITEFEELDSLSESWDFFNSLECIPSNIDIQFAIERFIANDLISKNSENQTIFAVYARSIPQFLVPSYELDFGNVIVGRITERTVTVTNYGPLTAVVYSVFNSQLKDNGFQLRLKTRNEVDVGDSFSFLVIFLPKKKRYKNKFEIVEDFFYFEVYHGPRIPIKIVASVTYPFVVPSMNIINYFDVVCGCCKVMNLKLHNPGLVPASWSMIFVAKSVEVTPAVNYDYKDGRSMFHLNYKSGVLHPGEYCSIQITFKPDSEGYFSATLWVHVEESLEELKVLLIGEGIEPKINVSENVLKFGPIPPYPKKYDKYFTLENPCFFPVEIYFPAYDEQIFEEDRILRALCYYYQSKELLLPVRKPGEGLPVELRNFYKLLMEDLHNKFVEQEKEKEDNHDENLTVAISSEDDPANSSSQGSFYDKKKRRFKKTSSTRTSIESNRIFTSAREDTKESSIRSTFQKKTSLEIEDMLHEYIKNLLTTSPEYDPIQAALKSALKKPQEEEEYKEGLLILFYGAPFSDSTQLANRASMMTGLPIFSIERLVLEEAAFTRCEAGSTVRELIEQAYLDYIEKKSDDILDIHPNESELCNEDASDFESAYEEIKRKLDSLVSMREYLIANKAKVPKSSSAKSENSRKGSTPFLKSMNLNSPIANISEDLVEEILFFRLPNEVKKGMILEGLTTMFFSSPVKTLFTVLKAVGNIKDILLITLINNYMLYFSDLLKTRKEQENAKLQLQEQILNILEEEPDDVLESLNIEKEEIEKIRTLFIQERYKNQDEYEVKKNVFYENLQRNSVQVKGTSKLSHTKPDSTANKLVNGNKKDVTKGTKTTAVSRGGASEDKTGKLKKDSVEVEFDLFEAEFLEIRNLVENWDQRAGGSNVENVSEVKTKKGQSPRKAAGSYFTGNSNTARGIHLWLVDVSRPEKKAFDPVCFNLRSVLQSRIPSKEADSWPLESTESMMFSVISFPPVRKKPSVLDLYQLSPFDAIPVIAENLENSVDDASALSPSNSINLNRSVSQISFKKKRRDCFSAKRRKAESRASVDNKSFISKKSNESKADSYHFKSRWILQPRETVTWRVRYFPLETGETQQVYAVNIMNWECSTYICCNGICDIPELDMSPAIIFPQLTDSVSFKSPHFPAYFYSENAYDFGSIIYNQPNDGRKITEKKADFTLLNKSTLPLDVNIILGQDVLLDDPSGCSHLKFQPAKMFLQPGEEQLLSVSVSPVKYGPVSEVLMLLIKDNPKIELIKVKFEGVKSNISVDSKTINFDRILLHRKDVRTVVFTNNNLTPLHVALTDLDKFTGHFTFSETGGWIAPLGTLKINIHYEATEVQQITDEPIQIQVFDDPELINLVQEFSLTVSVEAYDVALDVVLADRDHDHVYFGDIRVESQSSYVFNLINPGKYPVDFTIYVDQDFLSIPEACEIFIMPQEGKLQPAKPFAVTVSLNALNELFWQRVPLIKILILESVKDDELIATIPLEVSAKAFFPQYEITPQPDFNFGPVGVGSLSSGSLVIENKGHFPLHYSIEPKVLSNFTSEKADDTVKKSSKVSASSKEKEDKGKKNNLSITIGSFEISPSAGIIETGQSTVVNVAFCPQEVKLYESIVAVIVNESPSLLKNRTDITLLAEGCLPNVDFYNFKTTFREHFIAKSEDEFICPKKFESYTLFTENDKRFFFKNVCVCTTAEARIHLSNIGLIECHLRAEIGSLIEEGNGMNASNFSVTPNELKIEPYNFGTLTLAFLPEAIEECSGRLVIIIKMPERFDDEIYCINLCGNGVLPQIEIVEPAPKLQDGTTLVSLPPTAPKRCSSTMISFRNLGPLRCKVILEVLNNQEGTFTLIPKINTEKMLKVWDPSKPIQHTIVLSVFPDEVAEFTVLFNPQEIKAYSSQIKLFVVENPFENLCYKLRGEGYFEEIVIEKIKTSFPFLADDTDDFILPVCSTPGQYILNLNSCYIGKDTKALLRLLNKTQNDYYRFEWEEIQQIKVYPVVGHLYPNSYKEILIIFHPEEPVELDEVPLVCNLNKILFDSIPDLAWDSRLVQVKKSRKNETSVPPPSSNEKKDSEHHPTSEFLKNYADEPSVQILPESSRMLFVNVSGIADYARLSCDPTNIIFKNTYMFQTRICPIVLENCGNVDLEYKITFKSVTVWPLKETKGTQIRENSFLKPELLQGRPQSRPRSSYSTSTLSLPEHVKNGRPRPLSCASLLNLNKNNCDSVASSETCSDQAESKEIVLNNPFSIENASGLIPSREKTKCNIVFSPMDVNEYRAILIIQVPNSHPENRSSYIEIRASSIMPYCHFNLPESDYLESGRRDYSRPGPIGCAPGLPLDPDIKTIEIKVLGVGHTVPIKFYAINPTEEDYTFSWCNITQINPETVQSFYCSTLDGRIQAGRQQQMLFNFVSQKVGITESFWKFQIPEYNVHTQFLFVSDVREPSIYFLSSHINLRPTFMGSTSSEILTLVNHENAEFDFNFVAESLYSEGRLNVLAVEPTSGRILANSEFDIRVSYTGKTAGKVLFFLKCKVKCIKEPFIIAVETMTYVVQPLVVFEDLKKVKHRVYSDRDNLIDFGAELTPNRPETITLVLTSVSKTSFYYDWIYDKKFLEVHFCKLKFSVKRGHISCLSKGKCDISIMFSKSASLKNFPLTLKISRGPNFNFLINAGSSTPTCEFSFTSFDFGYCFLQERDICYYDVPLKIQNKDVINLALETFLPESSAFSIISTETSIQPGKEITIVICFHPKETVPYSDVLKIVVNGLHDRFINLKGCGTDFKVTLENPNDTKISLGAVKVGKSCVRKFSLINKSLTSANVLVGFSDQLPVNGIYLAKPEINFIDLSDNHRLSKTIAICPSRPFTIKPKQTYTLTVLYTPRSTCPNFCETVSLQYQEKVEPLCILSGCCIGPEISLDRSFLNFGAVVKDCSSILKLKLLNSGSIGARFEWMIQQLDEEYTIFPVTGYCSPESDVTIHVTFRPLAVNNYKKEKVECKLYLSQNETYPSQFLTLTGECVCTPEPTGTISFECLVRQTDSKIIEIYNWSGNEWQLVPLFSGEYFKGSDALVVPPLSSVPYEINYCPLTMTKQNFHEGSIFFRLPNGQGLLYQLKGTSLPPNAEDVIVREIPCKTKYVELLKIQNWLQYPQRLKVDIKCVSSDNAEDPVWTCSGLQNFELPTLSEKEYNLYFFAYKTGTLRFHVIFVNEETDEYKWFDISFKIIMCGPLEVITLKCGVRQTCHYELKLENPLEKTIKYKLQASSPEIHLENAQYELQPQEIVYAKISFTPIHVRETTEQLVASCPELGSFPNELHLVSLNIQPDPPKIFEAPLGSSKTQAVTVANLSHLNAVLRSRTDSEDFLVKEYENVGAGRSVQIKVTYEPSEMSNKMATLFVESEEAGNFVFPLLGICVKPPAKGPYLIRSGSGINISFKNVFKKAKEFYMYVDNPVFRLKTSQENIQPKGECIIYVAFDKTKSFDKFSENNCMPLETRFHHMGQLVIECFNPYIKWQFYLKGVP